MVVQRCHDYTSSGWSIVYSQHKIWDVAQENKDLDRYQTYKTGSNIYTKLKLNYINNNNQDLEDLLLLSSKKWYIFPSTAGEKAGFASYYIEKLLWKPVCQILVSKGTLAQAFHLSRFLVTNPTNLSLSHQQRITIIY